ncbi:MAG: NADH-quinone oxidoreductase subunit L [Alphaproteobacteria bacterium]|nr:NADH-quinone oxidoreductase subunit L [Alphaproteobacteria bacterium]
MHLPYDILAVFPTLLGAAVAGLFGRVIGERASQLVTCAGVLLAAAASMMLFSRGQVSDHVLMDWLQSGELSANWSIKIDTLAALMLTIINGVSSMIHIYSIGYMKDDDRPDSGMSRFMAYLSLFTFFMSMLVVSDNLLQLFFGWEGVGLASYLLINFWYEKDSANNAAIKAFIVNRVGDFGFALGIFACYQVFGSITYADIFAKAPGLASDHFTFLGCTVPTLTTICLLLFFGAMGKSAQLGLHTWLADAMEGPTPVSALIHAATMVTAGVFMLARLSPLFEYAPAALAVVTVVGALTCFIAASIGLTQFDIKRVIAYSTMSQLGYMFIAAGVSAYSAAVFHLMTHAFFKALLFLAAGSVIHALSGEQDLRNMGGLWRRIPFTYALMWIGFLALAGVGLENVFGFAGFYSKDLILESALASGTGVGKFAYILGTAAVFMTAFYSWRLLIMAFHGTPRADADVMAHVHESPLVMLLPLVPLALGATFAGWYGYGWFGGADREAFWKGALFILPGHDSIAGVVDVPEYEKWLPLGMALPGIFFAYIFYMVRPEWPGKLARGLGGLYRLIYRKYYFDEVYGFLFARPAQAVGRFLWKTGDEIIIDGLGPDGFASLSRRVARRVGMAETGYLYHYAFAMILGVAGFVSWFWFKG